jgi:hypothetical protein
MVKSIMPQKKRNADLAKNHTGCNYYLGQLKNN